LIAHQSEPGAVEVRDVPLHLGFKAYLALGADLPDEHRARESCLLRSGTSETCPASLLHRQSGTPRTVARMHYSSGAFSQTRWSTGLERERPADLSLLSERLL
jgi:hypothetical protein